MKEYLIASTRGRNPNNPSERKASNGKYRQHLEIRGGRYYPLKEPNTAREYARSMEAHTITEKRSNMRFYEPRNDNISNTITTVQKDNYLMEIDEIINKLDEGKMDFSDLTNDEIRELINLKAVRIRKLIPRECFRLMGMSEEDIDKIQEAGISQSQQYKMAGNSIVVDVLYYIFKNMFTETEASVGTQLSLF